MMKTAVGTQNTEHPESKFCQIHKHPLSIYIRHAHFLLFALTEQKRYLLFCMLTFWKDLRMNETHWKAGTTGSLYFYTYLKDESIFVNFQTLHLL